MPIAKITFLGTGTSQGVPVIGCNCEVCSSSDPKDNRLRSSILIETENKTFCVDTGPDFRQQMLRYKVQKMDAILFTHEHKDHTAGLDDVRAFNFKQKTSMDLFVNQNVAETLQREYQYAFAQKKYPGVPQLELQKMPDDIQKLNAHGVDFEIIKLWHYKLLVFGYKLGKFAYCTDVNFIEEVEKSKLKNLDVLVLPALRKEKHISHYNLEEALEVIEELKPKKAYLTHVSHLMGKHEDVSKEIPENVHFAYDGLTLNIDY
jgi:phosphoribosyl 1,2-cyclic phosphate phosphodiesterase